jgi:hypothetical protein
VINTNNDEVGSLRQAILNANDSAGPDTISFSISGCGGVCVIQPDSALPTLTGGEITIDGYSQPGAVMATSTTSATIKIEIDGTNAGYFHGLTIVSAGNVVRGLAIINFERSGVLLSGTPAAGNVVSGSHIGTGADGTSDGGDGWIGVALSSFVQHNTIGGDAAGLGCAMLHHRETDLAIPLRRLCRLRPAAHRRPAPGLVAVSAALLIASVAVSGDGHITFQEARSFLEGFATAHSAEAAAGRRTTV